MLHLIVCLSLPIFPNQRPSAATMVRLSGAPVVLLLLPCLEMLAMVAVASDADVNIYNAMGEGEVLQVICRKAGKSGDMGEKTVLRGEHFGWGFTPSVWTSTKYSCFFWWHLLTANFEVWTEERIPGTSYTIRPCTHCVWTVKQEGFYRSESGDTTMVFQHQWH